jgi:flavin-dependent dehydrogenase
LKVDVAVVGGGTAGSAVALQCARRGLRVAVLESGPLQESGARWVNGIAAWCFDEAQIERPVGAELHGESVTFHLIAGWDGPSVPARGMSLLDVDMRMLVARLQKLAQDAGATFHGGTRVLGREDRVLRTNGQDVEADWIVDASGLRGARLLDRPAPNRQDLCVAAQEVRGVRDLQAARGFFRSRGIPPGEVACFTGVAGGYSIVNVRVEGEHLSILTGSIPALGHPSGKVLLERFAREHDWVGATWFGGSRALPLRAPYLRLAQGRVALIGDAACQVYATHGSGIGAGLVAARMLAESLAEGRGVWDYCVRWQRRWGGLFAGAERFARHSRGLDSQQLGRLIAAGVMGGEMIADGLDQRSPRVHLRSLPRTLWGALKERHLVRGLAPVIVQMVGLERAFKSFPDQPDQIEAWAKAHRRLGIAEA